jgi:hypothetical protein
VNSVGVGYSWLEKSPESMGAVDDATPEKGQGCVAPGFIDTPMVASVLGIFDDPNMADRLTPMKRPGARPNPSLL